MVGSSKYFKKHKKRSTEEHECYTCNPSGKVATHIIEKTELVTFHYDMFNRPILIATPNKHVHTIFELSADEQQQMWNDIRQFLHKHEYDDFQIYFNNGNWQTHYHFHIKIRANEEKVLYNRKCHIQHIQPRDSILNVHMRHPVETN